MAAVATGGVSQARLVERGHLDQLGQFYPLYQQLGNPVTALDHDRGMGIEVDQRNLDLAAITGVYRARTVDDRKAHAGSQTRARMDQSHHSVRNGHGDTGRDELALPGGQLDITRAVEVYTRVPIVRPAGHR